MTSACDARTSSFSLAACQPTLKTFSQNLESLLDDLDAALAKDPGAEQVLVMAYANPWSGRSGQEDIAEGARLVLLGSDGKLDCAGQGKALGLNDRLACVGARHGAKLADAYPPFVGKGSEWFADEIHPNDAGHAALAAVFLDALGAPVPPPPPAASPPTVSLKVAPRARCTSSRVRATVTVTSEAELRKVTLSLDGRRLTRTKRASFHVRLRVRDLASGSHRFKAVAMDADGGRTAKTRTFSRCAAPRFTG